MKIVGRYPYAAEVLPKRARKPQRALMYGLIEYDIAEISAAQMAQDALVMQGNAWVRDGSDGVVRLPGWSGRLWRRRSYTSVEALLDDLRSPGHAHVYRYISPIFEMAYDPAFGPRLELANVPTFHDDEFAGEVLWSDKPAAQARAEAAARDILIVGEDVYQVEPCPVWRVQSHDDAIAVYTLPAGGGYRHHAEHAFRPDRLDDVLEWTRRKQVEDVRVAGEVRHVESEFVARDDLSNYVAMRLPHLASGLFRELLPHLTPEALCAWNKISALADRLDPLSTDRPLPFGTDPAVVARDVVACYEAVAAIPRLPTKAEGRLEGLVRTELKPFRERVAFEAERRPAVTADPADDDALSRLGPA